MGIRNGQTNILLSYAHGQSCLLSRVTRILRQRAGCAFRSGLSMIRCDGMVRLKRETGSLAPRRQGNPGRGKLTGVKDWVRERIAAQPDLTIDALTAELAAEQGLQVHRSSVGRLLHRLGLSYKRSAGA